mgnify:CR=1 FL=1
MACKLLRHATHFLANPKLALPFRSTTLSKMKFLKDQQTSSISFPKLARIGIHLETNQNGREIKNQER